MAFLFFLFFGIFLISRIQSAEIPSVSTKFGDIKGLYSEVDFKGKAFTVKRFLGIPYAKPPTGKLRFKKPEPIEQFSSNPFMADHFGSPCAQVDIFNMKIAEKSVSEDCLFLNVFVPLQDPDKESGHAVMVFVHGGAFSFLTGNRFIGDRLSSVGNVIVVTLNYRLWIWGFLDLNDDRAPGNMGLWDQKMAFRWVHENIESFGGDKNRVTIFGESAGAISVGLHALHPGNKGLFHNVIVESGSPTTLNLMSDIHDNVQTATLLAKMLNCNIENKNDVFDCIQGFDSEAIIKTFKALGERASTFMEIIFTPTVDGDFIKRPPSELFELAKTDTPAEVEFLRSLRFINGVNGEEGGMWLHLIEGAKESYEDLQLSKEVMDNHIIPSMLTLAAGSIPRCQDLLKSIVSFRYTDWENPYGNKRILKQFIKLVGDLYFNVPAIEFSRLHANNSIADGYLYRFTANVDRHMIPTPSWVDSGNHADELGPVFGFQFEWFDSVDDYSPSDWILDLSERMMTMWTNFAKYGYNSIYHVLK